MPFAAGGFTAVLFGFARFFFCVRPATRPSQCNRVVWQLPGDGKKTARGEDGQQGQPCAAQPDAAAEAYPRPAQGMATRLA